MRCGHCGDDLLCQALPDRPRKATVYELKSFFHQSIARVHLNQRDFSILLRHGPKEEHMGHPHCLANRLSPIPTTCTSGAEPLRPGCGDIITHPNQFCRPLDHRGNKSLHRRLNVGSILFLANHDRNTALLRKYTRCCEDRANRRGQRPSHVSSPHRQLPKNTQFPLHSSGTILLGTNQASYSPV